MSAIDKTTRAALLHAYDRHRLRQWLLIAAGTVILAAAVLISAGLGVESMGPLKTLRALLSPVLPERWHADIGPIQIAVLYNLRMPRAVMAIIGGASQGS